MRFYIFMFFLLMFSHSLQAQATPLPQNDLKVPVGDVIVKDNRMYSCIELSDDEKNEVKEFGVENMEIMKGLGDTSSSCLIRNTDGTPFALRERVSLPQSSLLTYNSHTNLSTYQYWEVSYSGVVTLEDRKTKTKIELPTLTYHFHKKTWLGKDKDSQNYL